MTTRAPALAGEQQWLILREVAAGTTMPTIAELLALHHRTLQRRIAADLDLRAAVRERQAVRPWYQMRPPAPRRDQRAERLIRAERFAAGEYPDERHGSYRAYLYFSCRCGRCRAAGSARNRRNYLLHRKPRREQQREAA